MAFYVFLALVIALKFLNNTALRFGNLFVEQIAVDLDISAVDFLQVLTIASACSVAVALLAPFYDLVQPKSLFILSACSNLSGLVLATFSNSRIAVQLGWCLFISAQAVSTAVFQTILSRKLVDRPEEIGHYTTIIELSWACSGCFGVVLVGLVLANLSWWVLFVIFIAFQVPLCSAFLLLLYSEEAANNSSLAVAREPKESKLAKAYRALHIMLEVFQDLRCLSFFFAVAVQGVCVFACSEVFGFYTKAQQFSDSTIALFSFVFGIGELVGNLVLGRLFAAGFSPSSVLIGCGVGSLVTFILIAVFCLWNVSIVPTLIVFGLSSTFSEMYIIALISLASIKGEVTELYIGTLVALNTASINVGFMVATIFTRPLYDYRGIIAVMILLGLLVFISISLFKLLIYLGKQSVRFLESAPKSSPIDATQNSIVMVSLSENAMKLSIM